VCGVHVVDSFKVLDSRYPTCCIFLAQGPDDVYENEDDALPTSPQPVENGGIDEVGDDEIYDDVEAPTEPQETSKRESVSSTKSNNIPTIGNKRTSGFLGSSKGKDTMPFTEGRLAAYIQKKGAWSWDKKWFVLAEQTLYYSNSESDKKCQGTLALNGASIDTKASAHGSDSRTFSVTIKHKSTKMQLAWDDSLVYDEWLKALKVSDMCDGVISCTCMIWAPSCATTHLY